MQEHLKSVEKNKFPKIFLSQSVVSRNKVFLYKRYLTEEKLRYIDLKDPYAECFVTRK